MSRLQTRHDTCPALACAASRTSWSTSDYCKANCLPLRMCLVILDAASPKTTHTHIHTQTDKHVHTPRFTPYAFYRDWHLHLLVEGNPTFAIIIKANQFLAQATSIKICNKRLRCTQLLSDWSSTSRSSTSGCSRNWSCGPGSIYHGLGWGYCIGAAFCSCCLAWPGLTSQMINMLTGPHLLFVAALTGLSGGVTKAPEQQLTNKASNAEWLH